MAVDLGLALTFGPRKGTPVSSWTDELDAHLPKLAGRFKSMWMTDHFFWKENPTHEAMIVLTYLATRWPQFEVGPMVLGQSYRNPALLAKMGATLQWLSGGRFIMGIGAGWKEDEYRAYNYPYPAASVRMGELVDTLEIMKRMWTEPGPVSYQGKHYQITDAYCEPRPNPVPPIVIGGGGNTTMKIAARYADWWNLSDAGIARFTDRLGVLRSHCEAIGRDPASLRITWFGRVAIGKTEAEALERGRGGIAPGTEAEAHARGRQVYTTENAFVGTPVQIVEQMQAFIDIGVSYFMIDILDLDNPDVMGMLMEEIAPRV
jgi:alkanesulfonate monooxygenase SsuD/methylene tetrahydromethanopterin reductase-like flavin-dependent oxidoreductase (luciferase family)